MMYDFIVIGGGSAGLVAAKFAKGLGKKTAIVEKNKLGGDCTHSGCIPSKTLLKSAHMADSIKNLKEFGLTMDTSSLDTSKVMQHVRQIVAGVYESETPDVIRAEGIDVIEGCAEFKDNDTIIVNGEEITSKIFLIATGSSPLIPPIEGLSEVTSYTNETIFYIDELPSSIAVLGGGPIGIELATAFNALGVDTAVIEMGSNILPKEDMELSELLRANMEEDDIKILTNTKVISVSQNEGFLTLKTEGAVEEVHAEVFLIAAGRTPNVEGMNLSKAGVKYNKHGIKVGRYLNTTAPNIYAAGDVVGPYQFTHVADYEAVTATRNALIPFNKAVDYSNIGWCTYTEPELARCGLTQEEAEKVYGKNKIRVFRYLQNDVDRAITDGTSVGMAKYVTNKNGKILGIHILGERAGEVIHEPMLAKKLNIPFQEIADLVHIYPTYSYAVRQPSKYAAVEMLLDNPIVKFIRGLKK
ncbi:MAG: mercuric reductase [Denitrovibrio sp.]|nr:MAG: mercuric reductase [Denitrovibrio sp.]